MIFLLRLLELTNLKPGDVGFVMNKAWISHAMAWFMGNTWTKKADYSHCFTVAGYFYGRLMVYETSDFEFVLFPLKDYLDGRRCTIFRLPNCDENSVNTIGMNMLGEKYGYLQLISLGLRRILMKTFGVKINNFIRWGLYCTVGPLTIHYDFLKIDPESIDTQELADLFESRGYEKIYEHR